MTECIFCAIARGDAERSLVHEDDALVVIMDLQPVNQGHALVLPKKPRGAEPGPAVTIKDCSLAAEFQWHFVMQIRNPKSEVRNNSQ